MPCKGCPWPVPEGSRDTRQAILEHREDSVRLNCSFQTSPWPHWDFLAVEDTSPHLACAWWSGGSPRPTQFPPNILSHNHFPYPNPEPESQPDIALLEDLLWYELLVLTVIQCVHWRFPYIPHTTHLYVGSSAFGPLLPSLELGIAFSQLRIASCLLTAEVQSKIINL